MLPYPPFGGETNVPLRECSSCVVRHQSARENIRIGSAMRAQAMQLSIAREAGAVPRMTLLPVHLASIPIFTVLALDSVAVACVEEDIELSLAEVSEPPTTSINSLDEGFQDRILKSTHAGGMCINEATFHCAQDDPPSGGVGQSGIGWAQSIEGFRNYNNQTAVFHKGKVDLSSLLFAPFGSRIHKLVAKWFDR